MARRILIGIAGGSGSGKTLVARTIVRELGSDRVVIIDQDSYYRNLEDIPFRDREARNFDHPDAFDNDLLKQHVRELQGNPVVGRVAAEALGKRQGALSLLGRQVLVARRHRQAVGLAHDRTPDHFDREVQVASHAPDD